MEHDMSQVHEGGCLCGAVRYRVTGAPMRTIICHCMFCQRRTGSAFGFMPYFKQDDVQISGALKAYEHRSDESHRLLRIEFCPTCGTTVSMSPEVLAGLRGIAGGTFDDPSWIRIDRHIWTRSAHPWITVPQGVEQFSKSSIPPPPQNS
jgi:hypothetical protein